MKNEYHMRNRALWGFGVLLFTMHLPCVKGVPLKTVASAVNQANVYLRGATISRVATARLDEGRQLLRFEGITASADPASVRCEGRGDFTILSVSWKPGRADTLEPQASGLLSSKQAYQDSLASISAMLSGLEEEKALLHANRSIGGGEQVLMYEDVYEMAAFYRNRFSNIHKRVYQLERQQQSVQKELKKLQRKLDALNRKQKQRRGAIEVMVEAQRPVNARFTLHYLSPDASWKPEYDFFFKGLDAPVEVRYKAVVRQSTGVDWKDVRLSLSPKNPGQSSQRPQLDRWTLPPEPRVEKPRYQSQRSNEAASRAKRATDDVASNLSQAVSSKDMVITTGFSIEEPVQVRSNGKDQSMTIRKLTLPAQYRYEAVPKIETAAFLTAFITDWRKANLLPGRVNLFIDQDFVGRNYLRAEAMHDTLTLSFGRDDHIDIAYKQRRDYEKKNFFGSTKYQDFAYEINIKNNRTEPIQIMVKDQIPISTQEDIEVRLNRRGEAKLDAQSGHLKWHLDVEPGQAKTIEFDYQVRYPADQSLF